MSVTLSGSEREESIKRASRRWWEDHPMDYVGYAGWNARDRAEAREFFSRIDAEFARQAYFAQDLGAPLFSRLIRYPALRGRRVLEVGCGLGAISAELSRQGARVTSVDLTSTGVAAVTARYRLESLDGRAVQGDGERLPFASESFDFVWSWGVLHHTPRTPQALEEVGRVLKPGGELSLMLYNRVSFYNYFNVILRYGVLRLKLLRMSVPQLWNTYTDGKLIGGCPHVAYYSPTEMRRMLPEFDVLEMKAFDQKQLLLGLFPQPIRDVLERRLSDGFFDRLFKRYGFLLYCRAVKR
jgi:SAM-dependent methyltransferase